MGMSMKMYFLVDYKNNFGSKFSATPYRSGLDKELLRREFQHRGIDIEFLQFCDVDLRGMSFRNEYIMYSSSEDVEYYYKSYIEDVCYALYLQGAFLIPDYKFLKAHSNKVFMEMLRDILDVDGVKNIRSRGYGTLEELQGDIGKTSFL